MRLTWTGTRKPITAAIYYLLAPADTLLVRSVIYFTTEHVTGPLGFFAWEVERPHTIFISPLAGIVALVIGLVLVMMARRRTSV